MSVCSIKTAFAPIPAIGVGGLVFNNDKILLIRRDKAPALGQWSVPGGRLEAGESLTTACVREILEETGIAVEVRQIVAIAERRVENFHYVIIDFLAEPVAGTEIQPIAASDVSAACWVAVSKLGQYDLVVGLQEIILRAFRQRLLTSTFGLCDTAGQGTDFILP